MDIGANAGFYTLAFSRLVGETGHVYAFEPLAGNVTNILDHVEFNKLDNITLVQAAVSDNTGIKGFRPAENNAQGAFNEDWWYKIPTASLDQLISEQIVTTPDLVKIDVEGAESLVLEGAEKLLSRRKTVFMVALHSEEQKIQCREMLETYGYRIFLLNGLEPGSEALAEDEIYAVPS